VNSEKKKETFREFMVREGLKSTRQRDAILGVFLSSKRHMSVEELYRKLRAKHPSIGYATVCRTLKLFSQSGIAHEIHFGDGQTRYEHLMEGEHHDHLVCTGCGAIAEFENKTIEDLQKDVAESHGFIIRSHKLELYGLCAKCRK
jgi:Fur family ferric uptake transcriptional regulator